MERIADYELLRPLREGNHGTYWLATPPHRLGLDAELVAVKVLAAKASPDDFRRMANELRIFAAADGQHLVRLHDAGHHRGRLFYTSDYYPNGSLAETASGLPIGTLRRVVADAARGAHSLHELGVAHRDIKPSNVLVDGVRGRLADLGLAQVLNPGQTITGFGPIGALDYMAPELVSGDPAGRASDIWALGCTLHRVESGRSIHPELPDAGLLEALRHITTAPPQIFLDDGAVSDLVQRCLDPDPAGRPATALEVAERLEAIIESEGAGRG